METQLFGEGLVQRQRRGQDVEGWGLPFPKHGLVTFSWTPRDTGEVRGGAQAWLTLQWLQKGEGLRSERTFKSRFGTRATAWAPCLCLRSSVLMPDSYQEANFPKPQKTDCKCYQLPLKDVKQKTMRRSGKGQLWEECIIEYLLEV